LKNNKYKERFHRAKKQLIELKRIYNQKDLNANFDAVCNLLDSDSDE
jgi:hypothetical protein